MDKKRAFEVVVWIGEERLRWWWRNEIRWKMMVVVKRCGALLALLRDCQLNLQACCSECLHMPAALQLLRGRAHSRPHGGSHAAGADGPHQTTHFAVLPEKQDWRP